MVYDEKVDWFSLGAVIYTLLAGFVRLPKQVFDEKEANIGCS